MTDLSFLRRLPEALGFYENAQPVSPDGPFEVVHAAARLLPVSPCPTCGGAGSIDYGVDEPDSDWRDCPDCHDGLVLDPQAVKRGARELHHLHRAGDIDLGEYRADARPLIEAALWAALTGKDD